MSNITQRCNEVLAAPAAAMDESMRSWLAKGEWVPFGEPLPTGNRITAGGGDCGASPPDGAES